MINLQNLIEDTKCDETVREWRWPEGVRCPHCDSTPVIKQGWDTTQPARQKYRCQGGDRSFDDLTGTVFAGHHLPLQVWILCLYFMGLNLSNQQIAQELGLNKKVWRLTPVRRLNSTSRKDFTCSYLIAPLLGGRYLLLQEV